MLLTMNSRELSDAAELHAPHQHDRVSSHDAGHERFCWSIFLCWCAIVVVASLRHEFWRDEVRALSLVMDARSLWDLPGLLQDEGHPILWYALLWIGYHATASTFVLPVLSILIGASAVLVLLFHSPLPRSTKVLFIFGGLAIYDYAVMARNYGISVLLLFVFAWLYPARQKLPILLGIVLALLCNTNVHSLLLACPLGVLWAWDIFVHRRTSPSSGEVVKYGMAVTIVLAGVSMSLATMWPTGQSVASDQSGYTASHVLLAVLNTLRDPALTFQQIAPSPRWLLGFPGNVLLLGSIFGLIRRYAALCAALAGWLALSVLFQVVYFSDYRHQGLFVAFLLTLYWIVLTAGDLPRQVALLNNVERVGRDWCLPVLLALLIGTGNYRAYRDLVFQNSASKVFGSFLRSRPEYRTSILIGEPDYALESVRYYADNSVYIVREKRFGYTVRFLRSAQQKLSLGELLQAAWEVQTRERRDVLIALGHLDRFDPRSPQTSVTSITYSFGRTFTWSTEELNDWNASTAPVRRFAEDVIGDERYTIYRLVAPPPR